MSTVLSAIGIIIAFIVIFALGWAVASAIVALGLNVIGGFGLSFAQVVGIGLLLAASTTNTSN